MIDNLQDRHSGKTCYIIGNGPSIKHLRAKHFGPGPVIALNQSIEIVEALGIKNPLYSMQKDGCHNRGPHGVCDGPYAHHMIRPKYATLLVHEPESGECFADYSPRYVWSNVRDFNQLWNANSAISAICMAHFFGCQAIDFLCFDSITNGDCGRFYDSETDEKTYQTQATRQEDFLQMTGFRWMYTQPVAEYGVLSELKGRHPGETCYIVGRGPSLKGLRREHFGPGPVITINEAIIDIEAFKLPNPVYALWRNGGEGDFYVKTRESMERQNASLILCDDPVVGGSCEWPPSSVMFFRIDNPKYVIDCRRDFNIDPGSCFSHLSAYLVANRYFGCSKVVSMCFDSYRGFTDYFTPDGIKPERFGCYSTQAQIMNDVTKDDDSHEWFFPDDKTGDTVTAITCTGDRPEAFALCLKWMEAQTRKPDQWIIVDDGVSPWMSEITLPPYAVYLRRKRREDPGVHTLNVNLAFALGHIRGDIIVFFEDDDYYSPGYIAAVEECFKQVPCKINGYVHAKYYHLPTGKYYVHQNTNHASLAQTAIRKEILHALAKCLISGSPDPLDMQLWRTETERALWVDNDYLFCGIKGMAGRSGISSGHLGHEHYYRVVDSPDRNILKTWIPNDYKTYLEIINREYGEVTAKLSIIMATRGRPENVRRIYEEIIKTADSPEDIEIVLAVDEDDTESHNLDHKDLKIVTVVFPPGLGVGNWWRGALAEARGRYVMFMPDDTSIKTHGWDSKIYAAFAQWPDDIGLVHVNDLIQGERLCTMPCMSRRVAVMSSIIDMRYSRYRIDDHIHHVWDVLKRMGHDRVAYLPHVVFEHLDYVMVEGVRRYRPAVEGVDPGYDQVIYVGTAQDRINTAMVLAASIDFSRGQEYANFKPERRDFAPYFMQG